MDYQDREVYPNAPIAIVTAEIQFGYEPLLNDQRALDRFAMLVRDALPLLQQRGIGAAGDDSGRTTTQLRATSQDRQTTATLSSQALEIAMSGYAYTHYEESFGPAVERVCDAFVEAVGRTQVTRIGLRYIDEFRVPEPPEDAAGWSHWVADELVAGAGMLPGGSAEQLRSIAQLRGRDGSRIVFQWGTVHAGTVVSPDLPFRVERPPSDIFVLDVDAAWEADGEYRMFETKSVAETLSGLHVPCGEIFANAQKPAVKELFRKESAQ